MEYIGVPPSALIIIGLHTLVAEVVQAMWDIIEGMRRPAPRQSKMNVIPVMLLGAGLGIATWEVVKRRNNNGSFSASKLMEKVSDAVDMDS